MRAGLNISVVGCDLRLIDEISGLFEQGGLTVHPRSAGQIPDFTLGNRPDVVIAALGSDQDQAFVQQLLSQKNVGSVIVLGTAHQTDIRSISRGLAMGFGDFITLPVSVHALRRRVEAYQDLILARTEWDLRDATLKKFARHQADRFAAPALRADDADGRVLLVGKTSPLHVQLSGILGSKRFMFAQTIESARVQLDAHKFRIVMLIDEPDGTHPEDFKDKLALADDTFEHALILAHDDDGIEASGDWLGWGFSDALRLPITSEFLRMRLGFWTAHEEIRGKLTTIPSFVQYPSAIDTVSERFNFAFAAEYLASYHAKPEPKSHMGLMTIRMRGLNTCNRRWGCFSGNRLLAEMGRLIARSMRCDDLIARLDGGLFVVIMSIPDQQRLAQVAERARSTMMRRLPLIDGARPPVRIETTTRMVSAPGWDDLNAAVKTATEADQSLVRSA